VSHQVGRKARLNAALHSKLHFKRKRGKSQRWRRSSAGCEHILTREPRLDVQHKDSTFLVSHCDSARCAALVIASVQVREICTERACEPAGMSGGVGVSCHLEWLVHLGSQKIVEELLCAPQGTKEIIVRRGCGQRASTGRGWHQRRPSRWRQVGTRRQSLMV